MSMVLDRVPDRHDVSPFFCKVRGTSMKLRRTLLEIAEWFKVLWPIALVLAVIILYGGSL